MAAASPSDPTRAGPSVVQLSASDRSGGAAVAAARLHAGLREAGVDSRMLVAEKLGTDPFTERIHRIPAFSLRRFLDPVPMRLDRSEWFLWATCAWLPNPALARRIRQLAPDLAHLHGNHMGFTPIALLPKLNVPVVITMHDFWAFCGAFHLEPPEHERFPEPYDATNRRAASRGIDIDAWVWRRKARAYAATENLTAICPSEWLASRARRSALWRDRRIEVVPNALNTRIFKPLDRAFARDAFSLPQGKKIIAFGAVRGNSDKNKGFDLLSDALGHLGLPREEVHLLVFGAPRGPVDGLPYPATSVGVARDEISLAVLYNAADVVAVPSRVESFGQTASEPLACGTPAVAFDASALPEIIDHRENGYLAKAYDPADFAAGLRWVLESPERHRQLAEAGRDKACRTFSQELVAARTKAIYASMSESTAA